MNTKYFNSFAGPYYRKIQIYMKKAFKQLGFSFEEGIVLHNVLFNPGTTQDRIAQTLVLDAAAVARSLKALEDKGYLTRVIDTSNQRRKIVTIDPAGEQIAQKIDAVMQVWNAEVFKGMSEEDIIRIVDSFQILHQRANEIDIHSLLP